MAKIEKNKLIEKVKELEGLSNDEKAALIGYIKTKTYGLVWEDSTEKAWEQLKDYIPVLTEDKSKAIINDTDEQKNPNHILIEGDNLLALTNLCFTHEGKVDVIYIDPPYNTGNKDFIYNDKFIEKDDEYKHSKWLSFISKRLRAAKKLLKDDGAIFISIDEHELYTLKNLCDDIFGEANFIGQWNWFKSATPPALSLKVKRNIEYIIAYEKKRSSIKYVGIQKYSSSNDPMTKPQNTIKELTFPPFSLNVKLPDGLVKSGVYGTKKFPNELLNDMQVTKGKNTNMVVFKNRFIWKQSTLDDEIAKRTRFDVSKNIVISYKRTDYSPEVPPNLIDSSVNVNTTEEAGKHLANIIGPNDFDYPKPVDLIKYLISFKNCSLIVDFFAGSGTTLHAVMELNSEDAGTRQCILVQGIEKDENGIDKRIAEKITFERNKRVIQGYTDLKSGEEVDGLTDNNLRYFKIGYVPREKDLTNIERFARQSVNLLCIKEDVYKEQKMFGELEADGFRYFKDGDKQFLVILEPDMIEPIIEELTKMDYEGKMPVYVFTTGHYPYTEDFWQVSEKVDLYPYPTCVYGACEKVMPKMEDKLLDLPDDVELSDEEANMTFEDLNKE